MWAVVYTHALKEFEAKKQLEQQAFEVYLPVFEKKLTSQKKYAIKPLFPRYLFVKICDQQSWRPILSTRGVNNLLLKASLVPQSIPDAFVKNLKFMENKDGIITTKHPCSLALGTKIQITKGGFEGQIGKITSMSDTDRIKVLIELLGTTAEVEVSSTVVEKI